MASQLLKAKCVLWYYKSKFVVTGKWDFLRNFGGNYQGKFSIYNWCNLFNETGCILKGKVPLFVGKMNRVQVALDSCRRNSTKQTAPQLRSHEWRYTKILRIPSILGKWPTWRTIFSMYSYLFIFLTLHVSSTSCSTSGETDCVNTTSGSCHCVSVAVSCAGRKWT